MVLIWRQMHPIQAEHVTTPSSPLARASGDQHTEDELFELVYEELRAIAYRPPLAGHDGETMQPTVLTNEVHLQFVHRIPPPPEDKPGRRATSFRAVVLATRNDPARLLAEVDRGEARPNRRRCDRARRARLRRGAGAGLWHGGYPGECRHDEPAGALQRAGSKLLCTSGSRGVAKSRPPH